MLKGHSHVVIPRSVCSLSRCQVYTVKPKKPNSAVRKVAKVMLTTGKSVPPLFTTPRAILNFCPQSCHCVYPRRRAFYSRALVQHIVHSAVHLCSPFHALSRLCRPHSRYIQLPFLLTLTRILTPSTGGRTQDLPGLKRVGLRAFIRCKADRFPCRYKIIRGALDLGGVAGRAVSRSKYGSKSHLMGLYYGLLKNAVHSEKAEVGLVCILCMIGIALHIIQHALEPVSTRFNFGNQVLVLKFASLYSAAFSLESLPYFSNLDWLQVRQVGKAVSEQNAKREGELISAKRSRIAAVIHV